MPSTSPVHSRALDALEASINSILLQTGSAFCDASNYDSWKIARTNTQLKHTLPPALSTFHDALDELERELIRARAVLRRDFNHAREHRTLNPHGQSLEYLESGQDTPGTDIVMVDVPLLSDGLNNNNEAILFHRSTSTSHMEATPAFEETNLAKMEGGKDSQDAPTSSGLNSKSTDLILNKPDLEMSQNQALSAQIKNDDGNTLEDPTKPQTTFTTPSNGETAPTSATNDHFAHDDIFGSTPHTANMTPNDAPYSNVDVSSLLPGLEFYANEDNTGDNDGMGDFVNLSNSATNDFLLNSANGTQSLSGEGIDDLMGTNFEDDFFANLGTESNNGLNGLGTGVTEDASFDESFFNLDP